MALAGGLQLVLLLGHELKAGKGVVAADPVGFGHLLSQVGGDNGLEGHRVLRQGSGPLFGCDQVVQQQDAGLVAGNLDVLAVLVLHLDGHPVRVGVGA